MPINWSDRSEVFSSATGFAVAICCFRQPGTSAIGTRPLSHVGDIDFVDVAGRGEHVLAYLLLAVSGKDIGGGDQDSNL